MKFLQQNSLLLSQVLRSIAEKNLSSIESQIAQIDTFNYNFIKHLCS